MSKSDSIDRLIDYTQTIKPYHTKIVEVLTNYTYEEQVVTKITDSIEAIPVPCVCDPNMIHAGIGWDTQPFAFYHWALTDEVDARGNFIYKVLENDENVLYDAPREAPPDDPEDCCTACDVWLCEGVGWDTQPFGLYETLDTGTTDAEGYPVYQATNNPDNVVFDAPNECPDSEEN